MQLREWRKYLGSLPGLDALVDRVCASKSPPVFMVGSALSLPVAKGAPGVPGVRDMVELVIRARIEQERLDLVEFQRQLDQAKRDGDSTYQVAFAFLRSRCGPDIVNEVVRDAVIQARKRGARKLDDDAALQEDLKGWELSRGTHALGTLLARFPKRYPGPTLTTKEVRGIG